MLARQDRSQQVQQPGAIEAARGELLGEVRIVLGGYRIDKRNLPAEQGNDVNAVEKRESGCACGKPERVARA